MVTHALTYLPDALLLLVIQFMSHHQKQGDSTIITAARLQQSSGQRYAIRLTLAYLK